MTLELRLEVSSGVPIYQQIVEQLRAIVACGDLRPGAELPSVRAVASKLSVNPMTVSKAYSLLQRDGIVVRRPGVGMFVTERGVSAVELLEKPLRVLIDTATSLGVTKAQVIELLIKQWGHKE